MSERDDWLISLNNEDEGLDEILKKATYTVVFLPTAQERKREIDALRQFVQNAPEDVITEIYPKLYPYQVDSQARVGILASATPGKEMYMSAVSTSGSAPTTITMAQTHLEQYPGAVWARGVIVAFTDLAEEKVQKNTIPEQLNKLDPKLGELFPLAIASMEKARSGKEILLVSQAAITLREVVSQIWGTLAEKARHDRPDVLKGYTGLQLSKPKQRHLVAECLSNDVMIVGKLKLNLDNFYTLYGDLSDSNFGKNLLGTDIEKLNTLYTLWITTIGELINLLGLSFA